MHNRIWIGWFIVSFISLMFMGAAFAQNDTLYRLEPQVIPEVPGGKITVVKGTAEETPHRFFLDNLNMLIPVSVVLLPENSNEHLSIAISKYGWGVPDRTGDTLNGLVNFRFRTQGEFQIAVKALNEPADYRLVVWVGDEVEPEFGPVIVKRSKFNESDNHITGSSVLWVIAIALLSIVVLLVFILLRKRK